MIKIVDGRKVNGVNSCIPKSIVKPWLHHFPFLTKFSSACLLALSGLLSTNIAHATPVFVDTSGGNATSGTWSQGSLSGTWNLTNSLTNSAVVTDAEVSGANLRYRYNDASSNAEYDLTTVFTMTPTSGPTDARFKLLLKGNSDYPDTGGQPNSAYGSRFNSYSVSISGSAGGATIFDPDDQLFNEVTGPPITWQQRNAHDFYTTAPGNGTRGGNAAHCLVNRSSPAIRNRCLTWEVESGVFGGSATPTTMTLEATNGAAIEGFAFSMSSIANIEVAKNVSATDLSVGDKGYYDITVTANTDGGAFSPATSVQITDTLPTGVTLDTTEGGGDGWEIVTATGAGTTSQDGGSYNPATGLWDIGTVNIGGEVTLRVHFTVDAGQEGNTINNNIPDSAISIDQDEADVLAGNDISSTPPSASVTIPATPTTPYCTAASALGNFGSNEIVGDGDNNLEVGEVFIYENIVNDGAGNGADLRIEILSIDGGPVKFNGGGNVELLNAAAINDNYVILKFSVVADGSLTAANPNGIPVSLNNATVAIKDIDSRSSTEDFSDIGGYNTLQGDQPDYLTFFNTVPSSFQNGGGPGSSFNVYAMDPAKFGDVNNWTEEPNESNDDNFMTLNYASFSEGVFLHGATGTEGQSPRGAGFEVCGSLVLPDLDFGDAPDTYNTTLGNGGAVHIIGGGVHLGTTAPDAETDAATPLDGTGDGTEDNGVTIPASIQQGETISLPVTVTGGGNLTAWIDWDNSGVFEAGEQIAADVVDGGANDTDGTADGTITLSVTAPVGASVGNTYARFRYSSDTALGATGTASDGEVEDYQVTIAAVASNPNLTLVKRITAVDGTAITTTIDDTTDNPATTDVDESTFDNEANWPTPIDATSGISEFLQGDITYNGVKPGEEIEYTIYFLSSGTKPITNAAICDMIPANTTYVPGSMQMFINGSTSNFTDASADDAGTLFTAGNTPTVPCPTDNGKGAVVIEVVNSPTELPNSTAPGTPADSYGYVRFRVTVD